MARQFTPQILIDRFQSRINIVKIIIAFNLAVCWVVINTFGTLIIVESDNKKGAFTNNFNEHAAKFVWYFTMYLLAAFLIIGLIKIKKVLPKSEFKAQAMVIHIVALLFWFGAGWLAEISVLFGGETIKESF